MSPARPPITPPAIEGFRYIKLLGSGGFADVFLYEREFPQQKLAIKVLLPDTVDDPGGRRFMAEANVMASLSTHPYIVTILEARMSPEGFPCLVMEYYPRPNFHVRARTERFSVAAVLRAGINVASAVETAHRIDVLHRDIKPANILTSEYSRPGLTDFGIASAALGHGEAEGMSIPWSPPEIVSGDGVGDVRSDVYSLGATLWTLLAGGRSPFEVVGGANRSIDLIDRIERGGPPAIDRPDVPDSLQRILAQAMAREPRVRPSSAAELARLLQAIEVEQHLDMTPFEVREEEPAPAAEGEPIDADAGSTRVKDLATIDPQAAAPPRRRRRPSDDAFKPDPQTVSATSVRPPGRSRSAPVAPSPAPLIDATPYVATDPPPPVLGAPDRPVATARDHAPLVDHDAPAASSYEPLPAVDGGGRRPPLPVLLGIGAAIVLVLAVVVSLLVIGGDDDGGRRTDVTTTDPSEVLPPPVEEVTVDAADGEVMVEWVPPADLEAGDTFRLTGPVEVERPSTARDYSFRSASSRVCVFVTVVRDGRSSEPVSNAGCS